MCLLGERYVWTSKNTAVAKINPAMWDIYRKSPRYAREKFVNMPHCLTSLLGESHVWTSKNSVVGRVNPAMWDIYRKIPRYV